MRNDVTRAFDHRAQDVVEVLEHLWYERGSTRRRRIDAYGLLAALLPRPGGPDLSTTEGRRTLTQAVLHPGFVAQGTMRSTVAVAMAVKTALTVDDVLAGRWHLVPDDDLVCLLEDLGFEVPPGRPRLPVVDATPPCAGVGALTVEFAFPWRPSPQGTQRRLGLARGIAGLTAIDATDAPIACSLWTRDGYLDVRRHGDAWLRPVLAPGSWEPVTLERFRRAAADGVAWRDSPFLPHTGRGRPTFHLSDYASPRAPAKGDGHRIARDRDACLTRAGSLCVIDGVVHRTAQEPLVGVAVVSEGDVVGYGPAWSLGDLDSTCSMATHECREGFEPRWCWGQVTSGSGGPVLRPDFVPFADWAAVVALLPPGLDWRGVGGTGRWSSPDGLVALGHGMPETRDGQAAFRAAARLSTQALFGAGPLPPTTAPQEQLLAISRLLDILGSVRLSPDDRRLVLARLGPHCLRLSEALGRFDGPGRHVWAFVVAFALHGVACGSERHVEDEELAEVVF